MDERKTVIPEYAGKWDRQKAGENAAQLISETANMFNCYYPERKWGRLIDALTKEVSPIATTGDIPILSQHMDEDGIEIVRSMFRVVLAEMDTGI